MLYHPNDDLARIAAFSDQAESAGFVTEPIAFNLEHPLNLPAASEALLICWDQAAAQQVKSVIDSAYQAGTTKMGLLRLQPQQPAQKLFRHPRLIFNLTADSAHDDSFIQALVKLKPGDS